MRAQVDWEAHPAELILAHSLDGKYLVKRRGLSLADYGKVDARAAKRQRLAEQVEAPAEAAGGEGEGGADDGSDASNTAAFPLPLALLEEYESYRRSFWASVHDRMQGGELDLDDLEPGSKLEACSLLGKLREGGQLLSAAALSAKGGAARGEQDVMMKVPAMATSLVVQRLLDCERQRAAAAEALAAERLAVIEEQQALIEELQAAGGGAAVMEEADDDNNEEDEGLVAAAV